MSTPPATNSLSNEQHAGAQPTALVAASIRPLGARRRAAASSGLGVSLRPPASPRALCRGQPLRETPGTQCLSRQETRCGQRSDRRSAELLPRDQRGAACSTRGAKPAWDGAACGPPRSTEPGLEPPAPQRDRKEPLGAGAGWRRGCPVAGIRAEGARGTSDQRLHRLSAPRGQRTAPTPSARRHSRVPSWRLRSEANGRRRSSAPAELLRTHKPAIWYCSRHPFDIASGGAKQRSGWTSLTRSTARLGRPAARELASDGLRTACWLRERGGSAGLASLVGWSMGRR